jgi:hypothetical protein
MVSKLMKILDGRPTMSMLLISETMYLVLASARKPFGCDALTNDVPRNINFEDHLCCQMAKNQ